MNCKVRITGSFDYGTLVNDVEHEYDAEHFALMDFYDRHPDLSIHSVQISVEKVEDEQPDQNAS